MSDSVTITSIVCITIIGIVAIFAILAHSKEKAILKYRNSSKDSKGTYLGLCKTNQGTLF